MLLPILCMVTKKVIGEGPFLVLVMHLLNHSIHRNRIIGGAPFSVLVVPLLIRRKGEVPSLVEAETRSNRFISPAKRKGEAPCLVVEVVAAAILMCMINQPYLQIRLLLLLNAARIHRDSGCSNKGLIVAEEDRWIPD